MADESVILDYVIRAQDQARGLLASQVALLQQLSTGINALVQHQEKSAQAAAAAAKSHQAQGDSLDRLIRLYDQFQRSNQKTLKGFEAMNMSLQEGSKLNAAQVGWLRALNTAVQQNSGFMAQNGQQWNQFMGQVKMGTQVTPQFIGQLNTLHQQFQKSTGSALTKAQALQNVSTAATAASAVLGGLAAMVGHTLYDAWQESIKQASLFQNTFMGLGTIAKSFGQDIGATTQAARDLASDGLMSVRESAAGLRNLLMAGFGLPEAINLMKGFKDIAAFNRQASLEFGYAIVSATEGIKNQNSLLVDNAGLTKNLTIILKEMGLSEQDLAKVQTDVNIRTKFYNGLLKEMSVASGDAARLTETYSGSVTGLQVQIQLLQAAIGERFLPILTTFNQYLMTAIGWLRNGESGFAGVTRFVLIATTAFAALAAALTSLLGIAGAVAGSLAILTGALVALGVSLATIKVALWGATGVLGLLALVAAAYVTWGSASKQTAADIEATLAPLRDQQAALKDASEKLHAVKEGNVDAAESQRVLRETSYNLTKFLPGLKSAFNDVDTAVKAVDDSLGKLNDRVRGIELRKVETQLQEFGASEEQQRQRLDSIRQYIEQRQRDILSLQSKGFDRNALRPIEEEIELNRKRADTIVSLFERQRQLTADTKAQTEEDKKAKASRDQLAEADRRYGELVKGQITTFQQYSEGSKKLANNIDLLVRKGMSEDAAMRLPEIVKQAKELVSASREGVAPMNQYALAIIRRGEAIERTRRLEQEAIEHMREQENRIRSLTRTHGDYTKGVESIAGKTELLKRVMDNTNTTFESSREELRPFQGLMQDIVDRVEELGEKAPPEFQKIRDAVLSLGGKSHLNEVIANNLKIAEDQTREFNAHIAKLTNERLEAQMEAEKRAGQVTRDLRDALAVEAERTERDSLEKREREIRRSFEQNTRDLDQSTETDKRIYDAYFKLLQEQLRQAGIAWRREYYGPTKADLDDFAAKSKAKYEEMRRSGLYTAAQIAKAWEDAYNDMKAKEQSHFTVFMANVDKTLALIANMSQVLSQISGDTQFAELTRWIGQTAQSMLVASESGKAWDKGMTAIKDKNYAEGFAQLAGSITQIVQAMAQATGGASRMKNALGGALVGAQMGAQVGGFYGAIVGAIAGALIGAFRKPEWKRVQEDIKSDLGEAVSEGLAKQIADLRKKMGISRDEAIALSLSAIIDENGGALSKYSDQINTLISLSMRTGQQGKKAVEELNNVFTRMVGNMNDQMHGLADKTMLNFIYRMKQAGVEVKGITEFLKQMADQAGEALNKVVGALIGQSVENMENVRELLDNKIPDLLKKEDELLDKIAEERDPRALKALNAELAKVREELTKAFAEADRLAGSMANFSTGGQESFDRMSRLISVTFAAGISSGKTFVEMLKEIGPSLDYMSKAAEQFGFTIGESFGDLLGLGEFARLNPLLLEGVDGMNQLTKALNNMGVMSNQTFNDLGGSLVEMRQQLMDAGATGEQSWQMMQPSLQTLWELQQRFGFEVDEATKKLLEEAEAAGVVGEKHRSATERMVAGIEKMVDRMERLLTSFGIDFPREAEASGTTASGAMNEAGQGVEDVTGRLREGTLAWQEWAAAAYSAGQTGYQATTSTAYGNSPGGLVDVQQKLKELKQQWIDQGKAIRNGMDSKPIDELLATLNGALHDLEHYTMSDINQALDDVEQRRIMSIVKFMKDMEGATQEMIDTGIAAINRLAELQSRDLVWDDRHRREKEALEEQNKLLAEQKRLQEEAEENARRWADSLREISEELALEKLSDPFEKRLLELQFQYQKNIEDFKEQMQGASQSQIEEGLRMLEELYKRRKKKIEDEAEEEKKRLEEAGKETQEQARQAERRNAMGTLSWAQQQEQARQGINPASLQQALQLALGGNVLTPGQLVLELPLGQKMHRFVVDLTKEANRNRMLPVESGAIVERLS